MQHNCHLSVLVQEQAKTYGSRVALRYRDDDAGVWRSVTWNFFAQRVKEVSNALLSMGIRPKDKIAVFSQNLPQYLYTDFGAYGVRAVSIPIYATSSEEQATYIIHDAEIKIIFVGEQEQYDKAHRIFALCPSLEQIVVFDRHVRISTHDPNSIFFDDFLERGKGLPLQAEVEELYRQADMDEVANILYTSGTTGASKGVMLTYRNYYAALEANNECVPVTDKDVVFNFLPYTHIFERGWTYLCISEGATLCVGHNPREVQRYLRETNPTCMSSVPRFWEKVYHGVLQKIESSNGPTRAVFKRALAVGHRHNVDYLSHGRRPPLPLALEYKFFDKTVFSLLRKELGLPHPNIFPTAGATVSAEVQEFIHSVGIYMMVGYGLTESLATVSCIHPGEKFSMGSIGYPISSISVRIDPETNEILLKGPTITKGYYHKEALTQQAFTPDGYFHTGDAGYLKDGELFLTDRIKDLFKTSNGKYIAPQMIETKLVVDRFVEQIAVIADQRKFVSALIVPEYNLLEEYARQHGIPFRDREELCANTHINRMMAERIETLQQQFASYEKIKRFTLVPHHFSLEKGELTNTLKIKRPVINEHYAAVIDRMYEEA